MSQFEDYRFPEDTFLEHTDLVGQHNALGLRQGTKTRNWLPCAGCRCQADRRSRSRNPACRHRYLHTLMHRLLPKRPQFGFQMYPQDRGWRCWLPRCLHSIQQGPSRSKNAQCWLGKSRSHKVSAMSFHIHRHNVQGLHQGRTIDPLLVGKFRSSKRPDNTNRCTPRKILGPMACMLFGQLALGRYPRRREFAY